MAFHEMKDAVLLVIGSVRDRDLHGARFHMMDRQMMAKVVRMSHTDYADFRKLLDEMGGIGCLSDIASYRPSTGWVRAIHSTKGHIGAVVMDLKAFNVERDTEVIFDDCQVFMYYLGSCGLLPAYV